MYLGFPFYLIQRKQIVLQKGETYRTTATPMEPQESYRGIYLPVQLPEEAEVSFPVRSGQTVFVEFQQTDQRLAIKSIDPQRPDTDAFLRATVRYQQDDLVFLDFPASAKKVFLTSTEAEQWRMRSQEKQPTESPHAVHADAKKWSVAIYVYRGRGIADPISTTSTKR